MGRSESRYNFALVERDLRKPVPLQKLFDTIRDFVEGGVGAAIPAT